jgi:DNA polymerase-3 subunit delta'
MPAALLLLGPTGVGKRLLATALAARLLCSGSGDDACGTCAQCTRVAAERHPDFRVVVRDSDRRDIRTEQVRELSRWLALTPLMADWKVGLIDCAHQVNEHGQNALLKTLEEPPGRTVLILTTTAPSLLLPTVRSRCRQLRLDPLPDALVREIVEAHGKTPEQAATLAALAEGSPGRALALADPEDESVRRAVLAMLQRLATTDAAELSRVAHELVQERLETALATMLAWYRDVLESALLGPDARLRHPAEAAAIDAAARRAAPAVVLRQLDAVCATIADIERNANRTLAVETLLLWLRQLERDAAAAIAAPPVWTNST